jgi:hypothetical protein
MVPLANDREIGRFDTNVNRFASDSEIQQRQRIVLPMDLANAPMDSFLRRMEPNQESRPVVSVGTQSANANTRILTSDTVQERVPTTTAAPSMPRGQGNKLHSLLALNS